MPTSQELYERAAEAQNTSREESAKSEKLEDAAKDAESAEQKTAEANK